MLKLQILVGSTRAGRNADLVMRWLSPTVAAHPAFESEALDLRDWPLPFFQETIATLGDFADPTYSDPLVKRWNQKIKEADAYLVVTPEYISSAAVLVFETVGRFSQQLANSGPTIKVSLAD